MSWGHHIRIGRRKVGRGHRCFIVAEAGVNHNGSIDMALQLVDVAAGAGADAVKFQKRELKDLYPSKLLEDPNSAEWAFQYLLPILKETELSADDFRRIKQRCDNRGIQFMCTPWDETSLGLLEELEVEVYKVSSADLVNLPLIEQIHATGKPLILSTGMSTLIEIERTVEFLNDLRASFALLHCVSTYPAPFESLNLRFMETLKKFNVPVGYSGHERGTAVALAALALGSSIIEKHLTLDRALPGPDHPASLEPQGLRELIRNIRDVELALGSPEKDLNAMEMINRQVLRKSLVAARDLRAGTTVTGDMIAVKGPGKGLSPQRRDELIGFRLQRDVSADEFFLDSDLTRGSRPPINIEGLRREWGLKARFHDLSEILRFEPPLVELHFSDEDIDYPFQPPPRPYPQRLIVHAPEFAERRLVDLCSSDEKRYERSLSLIQRTIDKSVELQPYFSGGPVAVVIHVGGMTMDEPVGTTDGLLERAVHAFSTLDSKGVVLLPENLPPRPWYLGGQWFQNVFTHAEEMVEFCRELGVGMTLDISHAQLYCKMYGRDLTQYVKTCLPVMRHMHISDASGIDGEGLQIGEGEIDWEEVLGLLSDREFTWVPEIWSGHLDGAAGFVEAINRLVAYDIL